MVNKFKINDSFWNYYQRLVAESIIPYQYAAINDEVEGAEKSHSVMNFKIAAGEAEGKHMGCYWQDSDTAKWLEAAAYSLMVTPDHQLEAKADEIIRLIGKSQEADGYLDTYFTLMRPDDKWTNLHEAHELYCAGHMIEAGVAYFEATGKTALLDIVKKLADLIFRVFGTDRQRGIPGHPEIELALVRLYRVTGERKYLDLACYFLDERGTDPEFFIKEREKRGWSFYGMHPIDPKYAQNPRPLRVESDAVGHAVRAVYLYTGMAMAAGETGDKPLLDACKRIWNSIVNKRMYLTGGIGSSAEQGEAFTMDYDLPNDTAYAETCASIGLMFFAKAMLENEHDAKYADVMETALYNTVLAGISRDGKKFLYTNPLEVDPTYAKNLLELKHVNAERFMWHGCACCPPNAARLLASLNRYAWHCSDNTLFSDLFIGGEYCDEHINLHIETGYPYDGSVKYRINRIAQNHTLAVRVPFWSNDTGIFVNNKKYNAEIKDGYALIRNLAENDEVMLMLDISPRKVYANLNVNSDLGKCAIAAGPLVYCFEDTDNGGNINRLQIDCTKSPVSEACESEELGSINIIKIQGFILSEFDMLYSFTKPESQPYTLTAIPYYAWGNRSKGKMRVWTVEK